MFSQDKKIEQIRQEAETDYQYYVNEVNELIKKYNDRKDGYNAQINLINNERFQLRNEIRELYNFLIDIGGSLQRKISVSDFKTESFAPNMCWSEIRPLDKPEFKETRIFWEPLSKTIRNHIMNKTELQKYEKSVQEQKNVYFRDKVRIDAEIKYVNDAEEIAKIYRNIIAIVRDTIKNKLIPEFEYIQAFLYADAIRERILENEELEGVEPCGIAEYQGIKQGVHYQFIKNAFDFYEVSTAFFRKTVLTDIIEDREISDDEKRNFRKEINVIKEHIKLVEDKKVM